MHPDDQAALDGLLSEAMHGKIGTTMQIEYRFRHKDERYRWFHDQFRIMHDAQVHGTALIGNVSDITDRKNAEDTLRSVSKRMESIIEGTNVGTWEWNVQTGALDLNEKWAHIIGHTLDELGSVDITTWERFAHPDDLKAAAEALARHFSGDLPFYEVECRMRHRDGHWVWVLDRGSLQSRTDSGEPLMMYGTHTDITERKYAEATLEKSYAENRVLLAELQHRVKNSFSMISSMIHLAAASQPSPDVTVKLADLDARVKSVSDLYSLLYASGSFAEARLDDYCRRITGSLAGLSGNITMKMELESVMVPVKIAAPFGLIVNELLTNAIKYAFPGNRQGLITVRLQQRSGTVLLEVQDDGTGIPAGVSLESGSGMGFSLVHGLAAQINGRFSMETPTKGTKCIVQFPGSA